ncbi:unnamed protein product (macronuclear) [Paramecium tetraurelia]|uniref:Response regulatory domain-containing protein n=1 Tax=Paramecium tetraurelia TaxID=5888 RepID=A0CWZ6_PARTE|nr:uncharacterized protein GSPATT00001516001 [Paramecium tetraurelia]CAK75313.1 unnamed protein product [Paramecium tetraurelia]|eukprot:XP_001442710.1 hypothetical protein (macronuclear) [Paramecium tetraurelia strain d4-2]
MIFYKRRRGIHFTFALKLLLAASFSNDIYLIVISSVNLLAILIDMLMNRKQTPIWKYIRIILLLELSFNDQPFGPLIIASINYNLKYKIVLLSFYILRASLIYFHTFKIIDWVYTGIIFVSFNVYFYLHDIKQTDSKLNCHSQRKLTQYEIPSQNDSNDVIDFFNYIPIGICLLDNNHNIVNSNNKAKKYCSLIKEDNLQQQLLIMIHKAWIEQQQNPTALRCERRSIITSFEEQGSDFQLRRMKSFSQTRKKAISLTLHKQQSNFIDFAQIVNKFKSSGIIKNLNSLKYRDQTNQKAYEIKIYETSKGYLILLKNITKKEKQIDMKDRYHFQQMLINSFSHELRTPLNCSLSLLQTLKQEIKSDLNDTYLKPAIISNKKLLHQINDILDFANFEVQTFKLRPYIFKLSHLIQTIEDYFKPECQQKKIDFIISACNDAFIRSDFDRILQILVNLLNNSVKFTRKQGVIKLNIQKVGSLYQFEVYDTGCGISTEKLLLINKILQNTEVDLARRGEEDYIQYVGLGLKVSSQIARNLCDNGELFITSQLNQYTNNRFIVKDQQSNDEALTIPTDEGIQEPYKSNLKRQCNCLKVLIVDDIPFNHLAFKTVLKYFNIKCDSAYDGSMAIDMIKTRYQTCNCTYKLIFMDIDMPGIDGYQATKEIQQFLEQQNTSTVIIMCSAFDSKENIDTAYKCGMKDILPKPIENSRLKTILYKYYF